MGLRSAIVAIAVMASSLDAFTVLTPSTVSRGASPLFMADTWDGSTGGGGGASGSSGSLEQIEFKIYPDGRIEETVRGVKGGECHKVTEKINELLGEVVASQPTEEMYEQEIVTDQTLYNSESSGDSSWEGSSSW
uniref:Uncharacterized protein n=1 Tax=Entomoneis paludosa TaxID=265537 RepID=A0A7S2YGR7_9STRA|mmetsp:Transcript_31906/g.66591  ORF Transcript_31906/g.66591 Transcript_31906/m.66591 type:complete len:135 (+) Transcript_31906:95-499(+)